MIGRMAGAVVWFLSAIATVGILVIAVEHWIFGPYLNHLRRTTVVNLAPAQWEIEAQCPRCRHIWTISADTRTAVLAEVRP